MRHSRDCVHTGSKDSPRSSILCSMDVRKWTKQLWRRLNLLSLFWFALVQLFRRSPYCVALTRKRQAGMSEIHSIQRVVPLHLYLVLVSPLCLQVYLQNNFEFGCISWQENEGPLWQKGYNFRLCWYSCFKFVGVNGVLLLIADVLVTSLGWDAAQQGQFWCYNVVRFKCL